MTSPAPCAVLVPIKSFDLAKGRLADTLDTGQRAELARAMAATVLAAARPLSTFVICGDADVAAFAVSRGANVIWRVPAGLNRGVQQGVDVLRDAGFGRVIVSHADLPLATDLTWLATVGADVVVVPDRHGDGSNVVSVTTRRPFRFAYGPGSAAAHETVARELGLSFERRSDDLLGWDVDVPDDLTLPHPTPTTDLLRRIRS